MAKYMKEIMITSSVLILCIMLIRIIFKGKISSRLQYALWFLVALRLMVPTTAQIELAVGSIGEFRIMDLVDKLEERIGNVEEQLERPVYLTMSVNSPLGAQVAEFVLGEEIPAFSDGPTSVFIAGKTGLSWMDVIRCVWHGGMAVAAVWVIVTNFLFWRKLRKGRKEFVMPEGMEDIIYEKLKVRKRKFRIYTVEKLASPCLYGLPGRESIYLTPDVAKDTDKLLHVLMHEICHKKHGDSFWSVTRSILVTVYWFDPLVWVAAVLSKRDCELACDEEALSILGDEERIPYGETLLSIITRKSRLSDIACTATTMTESGKSVKERIKFIAEKPKTLGVAVMAALLIIMVTSVFVFTRNPLFNGYILEGEVTLTAGDMQVKLPKSIAGIGGYTVANEKDVIIYQTASGKEAGRFSVLTYSEADALLDAGREIILLGNYGQNYYLRQSTELPTIHDYKTNEITAHEYSQPQGQNTEKIESQEAERVTYLPKETITTVQIEQFDPSGKCYIYLKADYSDVKSKDMEEMEYINSELEAASDQVVVVSINEKIREELFRTLSENRTEYLGNSSKTSALTGALPRPEGLAYKNVTLHTLQTEPETALSLDINYELTADDWTDVDGSDMMFFNAAMLFATIRNLEQCNFVIEENGSVSYERADLEESIGMLWSDEAAADGGNYDAWLENLYTRVTEYLNL